MKKRSKETNQMSNFKNKQQTKASVLEIKTPL